MCQSSTYIAVSLRRTSPVPLHISLNCSLQVFFVQNIQYYLYYTTDLTVILATCLIARKLMTACSRNVSYF